MSTTETLELNTTDAQIEARILPHDLGQSDWLEMFDRDPEANPYQHPDYVKAELAGLVTPTSLTPAIVRIGNDTECEGVGVLVPKIISTAKVGGIGFNWSMHGFLLAGGRFLTADHNSEHQSVMVSAALRHCINAGAEFLLIEDLDNQSPLFHAVQGQISAGFRIFPIRQIQPRWRIEFPTVEEDYWKTFSSRTRRVFRSRLKKFGQTQLERITRIDQVPAFLSAAHEISKQSWQSRQFGIRIRNDEHESRCLNVLAEHGFLRSYLWQVEGQPAAFAICHQHAGYFRYEEIAYCAKFSPLSPGETMLQQIVEDLYQHDLPKVFDFGGGDAEYKRRFGNLESCSQSVWLVPPTWRAGTSLVFLNGCRELRTSIRSAVRACGLATKARQWLRYGGRSSHPKAAEVIASANESHQESDATLEGKQS